MASIYLAIIVAAGVGIALMLGGVRLSNPFAEEDVATPEALNFWAEHGARLNVAGIDIRKQAEWEGSLGDACVPGGGGAPEVCSDLAHRFAALVTRTESLLAETSALTLPATDPTVGRWVDRLTAAWRADLEAIRQLEAAARGGFAPAIWERAITSLYTHDLRGDADEALSEMLPNRTDFTPVVAP